LNLVSGVLKFGLVVEPTIVWLTEMKTVQTL